MADLGCSPSAAVAFDYLVSRGLRDFQAAAVIGNLQQESGLDPRAFNSAEGSYGIAQWRKERWQNLLEFAAGSGRSPWSFDVQLAFLWHELESTPYLGLDQLRASTTLEDATVTFQNRFERPKSEKAATENRIGYARSALFACPAVKPPLAKPRGGAVAAIAGVLALVTAAGYGVYKALAARPPKPEPEPELLPPPTFRRLPPLWKIR